MENEDAVAKANRVSKSALLGLVNALDWKAIEAAADRRELLQYRSARGENYLHVCCAVDIEKFGGRSIDSVKCADLLMRAGLEINREAFREGKWKATPLWYAIARGKNLQLAKHLLARGADPEHCLWAAAYNNSPAAVHLLVKAGATIDATHDGETPLLFAAKWSRFDALNALLECGANANQQDESGNTALHYLLKKRSDAAHIRALLKFGARVDISNLDGITAQAILSRSRNPEYSRLVMEAQPHLREPS